MAKNKVILGHLSGSAVFLNPVCMIVTKMHFKEPDEGIIISKETIHTWEFVTDEALYEWWKRKITEEVKAGGRYFSIMALNKVMLFYVKKFVM